MSKKNDPAFIEINPQIFQVVDKANRSEWQEEMYVSAGEEVGKLKYYSQWILGKLAYEYTDRNWGDCSKYARAIHVDPNSLIAYRRVYKKIHETDPNYIPDGYIPWGVLQLAAETEDPIGMIEELSSNDRLSVAEAYRYKKEKETGKTVLTKPKVHLRWNEENGLWKIEISGKDFEKIDWEAIGKELMSYLKKLWHR